MFHHARRWHCSVLTRNIDVATRSDGIAACQQEGSDAVALAQYRELMQAASQLRGTVCARLKGHADDLVRFWHRQLTAALQR